MFNDICNSFSVVPTKRGLGAELLGVDVRHLDDNTFNRLLNAWADHSGTMTKNKNNRREITLFMHHCSNDDFADCEF
jgi:hypothetical protein